MYEKVPFGNIFSFHNGKSIKASNMGEYPVYGSNGIIGYTNSHLYSNSIILGRVGAYCGSIMYCKDSFWASDNTLVVDVNEKADDKQFCYYMLQTLNLNNYAGGSAQPLITQTILRKLLCPRPTVEQQHRIAKYLSAYDDLIENNKKQIKLLEEMAQRLYKEWFVDLRFPGYEETPIVDGVPKGWKKLPIGNLIEKTSRTKQIMASDYANKGAIPIIDQSRDFIAGYTDDYSAMVNIGKSVIVFGDHTRILKYIQFPFAKGADGTQLIVSNTENMPQSLFYCSLVGVDLSNYHYARHFKYLKAEEILVPTKDIAEAFNDFATPIFSKIQRLRDIIKNATEARDRLLPKLMNGEIEV